MQHCRTHVGLLLALLTMSWQFEATAADLPTAEQILQIHRENRERLSRLHLQVVHRLENTEASRRYAEREVIRFGELLESVEYSGIPFYGPLPEVSEAVRDMWRRRSRPIQVLRPLEIFLNGEHHQYRQSVRPFSNEGSLAGWAFSESPVTRETLRSQHRDVVIYSGSARDSHTAQWWGPGATCAAPDRLEHVVNVSPPPYTAALGNSWSRTHPYDLFFSAEPESYQVVRVEGQDGEPLIVVDATVRLGGESGASSIAVPGST